MPQDDDRDSYSAGELEARLGKPFDAGNLLGSGSKGWTETPWGTQPRAPLGDDRFMLWDCLSLGRMNEILDLSTTNGCMAIQPSRNLKAGERWFVVRLCEKHANDLVLTPFTEVFAGALESEQAQASPMLLIVDDSSYLKHCGPDWQKIEAMLDQGWVMTLVHSDYRFPDFAFVVLENASPKI